MSHGSMIVLYRVLLRPEGCFQAVAPFLSSIGLPNFSAVGVFILRHGVLQLSAKTVVLCKLWSLSWIVNATAYPTFQNSTKVLTCFYIIVRSNETTNSEALGELQVETSLFESRDRMPDRQLLSHGDNESPAEIEGLFASPISGLAALIFRLCNLFLPVGDLSI